MILELVRLAALDALIACVGWALLRGLGLVPRARPSALEICLGFLVGWCALGVLVTLLAVAGVPPTVAATLVVAGLLVAGARVVPWSFWHGNAPRATAPSPANVVESLVSAGARALLALALLRAALRALWNGADASWDVWAFWLPKARSIYHFGGLDTGAGGITSYANPEYPPLLPVMDAVGFGFLGSASATTVPLQRVVLAAAFFGAVAALLRGRVRPVLLWPPLALLATAPGLSRYMDTALADPVVAYLLAFAGAAGASWLVDRRPGLLALSAVALAAGALTKPEGLLLGVALAGFVFLATVVERRPSWTAALVAVVPVAAVAPWNVWLVSRGQELGSAHFRWSDVFSRAHTVDQLDRLGFAGEEMARIVLSPSHWLLVLPTVVIASAFVGPRRPALALVVLGWLALAFAGLAAVYWISSPPVSWYVATSADRVLVSLGTFAGVMLPLLLSEARWSRSRYLQPPVAPL